VALLLASVLGYAVSALALRTVETMRRRASALSVTRPGQRLPVPAANDELRSLAVTLNAMLERTEAAFARERRFVADASHELRTPLSILKAELEVALIGPGAEPELRAALASADAEADRVIRLAQDLLVLAQADHGSLPIEPADAYVKPMLERLQHKFAPRAQAARRMVVSSAPDDLVVKADPARLEQALASLVDNALAHGTGSVVLSALRKGHTVELHVADEGPGFPEPFLDIAFERFTRAEAGRTHEGTGLGLAIVRSIGRAHGGDAHVINRASCGADVWITLPQRETPSRRPAAGSQAPTNSACEMATRTM
jgi:signal transduction histidine kinase